MNNKGYNHKKGVGQVVRVTTRKGHYIGTVDRTIENPPFHTNILVTLPCGYTERFFIPGLSDREYLRRARYLKKHS